MYCLHTFVFVWKKGAKVKMAGWIHKCQLRLHGLNKETRKQCDWQVMESGGVWNHMFFGGELRPCVAWHYMCLYIKRCYDSMREILVPGY